MEGFAPEVAWVTKSGDGELDTPVAVCACGDYLAVADAGNRWIFRDLAESGLEPWEGVRWVAVAASPRPTHAVAAEPGMEQAVRSLLEHRAYIEALTDTDPETYAREFLAQSTGGAAERFGGRPAVVFEVFAF